MYNTPSEDVPSTPDALTVQEECMSGEMELRPAVRGKQPS